MCLNNDVVDKDAKTAKVEIPFECGDDAVGSSSLLFFFFFLLIGTR